MEKIYKTILGLAVLLTGVGVNAQVSAYSFIQTNTPYLAITGGTVYGDNMSDDEYFTDPASPLGGNPQDVGLPIGFNFVYNGVTFDRFGISNNGWISLGQSTLTPDPVDLDTFDDYNVISAGSGAPTNLQNRIAGLSADIQAQAGSSLRVQTLGTAPNRTLVVQFAGYRKYNVTGDAIDFQIRLTETSNIINILFGPFTNGATAGSAELGLRGNSNADFNNRDVTSPAAWATSIAGTVNTAVVSFNSTLTPVSGQNYRWTPPPACAGAPAANSAIASNGTICANGSSNLSLATTYTVGGLAYQWLSATTASTGPYSPIASATLSSFGATAIGVTTWYRCVITCTNGPVSTTASAVQVSVSAVPSATASSSVAGSICAGLPVAFTSSTNIGTSFYWTGPNSFTSSVQNPTIASIPANGSGNYNVVISVGGCSATAVSVPVTVNSTNLNINPSSQFLCGSGSATLAAVGNATAVAWNTSATTTSIVVTPSISTVYSVTGTSASNCSATAFFTLTVQNPTITGIGTSVCNPTAIATLTANAFAPVSWYATPTSTAVLGTGPTFTASAAATTTFYAQAVSSANLGFVGMTNNSAGGGQQTSTNYNIFNVFTPIVISSVEVYPGAAGNVVVELRDNVGTLLTASTIAVSSAVGPITIPINFSVNPGNGYRLAQGAGSVSMFRNSTGVAFPYSIPGVMSMTNSAAGTSFYYFFYNWSVTGQGCNSPKIPVVLTSTTAPAVVIGSSQPSVCPGGTVNIGVTGASSYTWSTGANGASISPTVGSTTTYSVVGASGPGCSSNASITITTGTVPSVSASSSSSLLCAGGTASITASGAATYTWNTTATTAVIAVSPTVTTSYTVTGAGANGCKNIFTISQAVSPCTGLDANTTTLSGVLVYPNPNTGLFTVELNNGSVKTIEVMDVTGRVVLVNTTLNDKINLNINTLSNGVYYVRVQSNNSVEVIKVVKQ